MMMTFRIRFLLIAAAAFAAGNPVWALPPDGPAMDRYLDAMMEHFFNRQKSTPRRAKPIIRKVPKQELVVKKAPAPAPKPAPKPQPKVVKHKPKPKPKPKRGENQRLIALRNAKGQIISYALFENGKEIDRVMVQQDGKKPKYVNYRRGTKIKAGDSQTFKFVQAGVKADYTHSMGGRAR